MMSVSNEEKGGRCYTPAEVAARLGIGKSTLFRWVRSGRLPRPLRFGRRATRWPAAVVEGMLREGRGVLAPLVPAGDEDLGGRITRDDEVARSHNGGQSERVKSYRVLYRSRS